MRERESERDRESEREKESKRERERDRARETEQISNNLTPFESSEECSIRMCVVVPGSAQSVALDWTAW